MNKFSKRSLECLETCHPDLVRLFNEVIVNYDCAIIEGHRGEKEQNEAFKSGRSKVEWPHGKHNQTPSLAVDVMPSPVDFKNVRQICHFAGYVLATADRLAIKVRWGGDFNRDGIVGNDRFFDSPHWELEG